MSHPLQNAEPVNDSGGTAHQGQEEVPLLSRIVKIADGLTRCVRNDPALRHEVLSLLHQIERSITPISTSPETTTEPEVEASASVQSEHATVLAGAQHAPQIEAVDVFPEESAHVPAVALEPSILSELEAAMGSLAGMLPSEAVVPTSTYSDREPRLEWIARTCRLKSEACVWAIERRKLIQGGADFRVEIAPRDREMIERAKGVENCYLWMASQNAPMPSRFEDAYMELADCYENVASVADLLARMTQENAEDLLEDTLLLAAEAQSALREAVSKTGYTQEDFSQLGLFRWLQSTTLERQVYIPRFMRRTDSADPSEADLLAKRIEEMDTRLQSRREAGRREKKALSAIRHHLKQLALGRDNHYDWKRVFQLIDEVVPEVMDASDVRLRQLLLEHLNEIPDDCVVPEGAQRVLEAIDQFLATRPDADEQSETTEIPSENILQVRAHLRGKTVVIIGGDARPYARESLQRAYELKDVVWVTSREHQSPEAFRPAILSQGVGVVLLAIRWSSHCFGVVRDYCEEAGVPFVRLPAGYGVNQVTRQILEQVFRH